MTYIHVSVGGFCLSTARRTGVGEVPSLLRVELQDSESESDQNF